MEKYEFSFSQNLEEIPESNSKYMGEQIDPFRLDVFGYLVFAVSEWFLVFVLLLIIKHKKDDHFLYRSPNLVILSFSSALVWQTITGLIFSFNSTNNTIKWIGGHIAQYVFYPIFWMSYVTRALRLVILFKRAEKGLYFQEKIASDEDVEGSTMAILRKSNDESEGDISLRGSFVRKPKTRNFIERLYYWFLFKFESELSYFFFLTVVFSIIPIVLMLYYLIKKEYTVLPLVNSSQWFSINPNSEVNHDGIMYDIILRNIEWYITATVFIMLIPIRKDFSIISEAKSFMVVLFLSSIIRNLIEIFVNNGNQTVVVSIDSWLFYLQTIVFFFSVVISFIYPVLIKSQLIIPLPSVPERIFQLQTAILEPRGFRAFYEWLEEYNPDSLKYLDCYCRIRFYKNMIETGNVEEAETKAEEIKDIHMSQDSEDRVSFASRVNVSDSFNSEIFNDLQRSWLRTLEEKIWRFQS